MADNAITPANRPVASVPATTHSTSTPGARPQPSSEQPVISADAVWHSFGDTEVLRDISLSVRRGELFGLVGPSGCGKTTLVRMIVGLLKPTQGDLLVEDIPSTSFTDGLRRRIGYVPQEFSLFPMLTVQQNARFASAIYGLGWSHRRRRIRDVFSLLELTDVRTRRADEISGGMRRRLALACALLHEPELLVIDEPTTGLDPDLRVKIWQHLRDVQSRGTTIFLTTQNIDDTERCDNVAILREGRVVAFGTPAALRDRAKAPETIDIVVDELDPADVRAVWALPNVDEARRLDLHRLRITTSDADHVLAAATTELVSRGRVVQAAETSRASFEDVFLRLVGSA